MSEIDFGFTAVTEEELHAVQKATETVQTAAKTIEEMEKMLALEKKKVDTMYNMIVPLLNNLAKNPEKDYIYWKGDVRLKKIEEFRDKLDGVYSK